MMVTAPYTYALASSYKTIQDNTLDHTDRQNLLKHMHAKLHIKPKIALCVLQEL